MKRDHVLAPRRVPPVHVGTADHELVADGVDPRALVLLDGFTADESSREERARSCTRVFIYALNVARLAGSIDDLEREITLGLEREITATFLEAEQSERHEKELN